MFDVTLLLNEHVSSSVSESSSIEASSFVQLLEQVALPSTELVNVLASLKTSFDSMGIILSVGDNVLNVRGLQNAMVGEVVSITIPGHTEMLGQALNLNADGTTGVVLFGDDSIILPGYPVYLTGKLLKVQIGLNFLGTIVDALGAVQIELDRNTSMLYRAGSEVSLDTTFSFLSGLLSARWADEMSALLKEKANYDSLVEVKAPGIITRQTVNRALYTGIKAIDGLIPVGRGQRELIIGDRQVGKTTIGIDAILRQNKGDWLGRRYDVFSVYVAIGQKRSSVLQLHRLLRDNDCLGAAMIVAATASEPAALQFLAPYTGVTFGEYFRDNGRDALIIYDDLSKHAVAYRQMSLLLRRPPGREAYPGDVFYLHSRLLERAAQLNTKLGGGSLTALPIIETQGGDVTAYIPTNVISITDGQIFLEAELFYKGVRPAINMGLSVSRVGSTAQLKAMRQVAGSLKLQLAQFRELEAFVSFGAELDEVTQKTINRGLRLVEILKQKPYKPYDVHAILVTLYAGLHGFLDKLPVDKVSLFEQKLIAMVNERKELVEMLKEDQQFTPVTQALLTEMIQAVLVQLN